MILRSERNALISILVALSAACSPAPAPQLPTEKTRPMVPRVEADAGTTPNDASAPALPEQTAPSANPPAPQAPDLPGDQAPAAVGEPSTAATGSDVAPPPTFTRPPLWYCLKWVHGKEFSMDCFAKRKDCLATRAPEWLVMRNCLAQKQSAWCTELPADDGKKGEAHCFGYFDNCEMYRAYVSRSSSKCVEVPTMK